MYLHILLSFAIALAPFSSYAAEVQSDVISELAKSSFGKDTFITQDELTQILAHVHDKMKADDPNFNESEFEPIAQMITQAAEEKNKRLAATQTGSQTQVPAAAPVAAAAAAPIPAAPRSIGPQSRDLQPTPDQSQERPVLNLKEKISEEVSNALIKDNPELSLALHKIEMGLINKVVNTIAPPTGDDAPNPVDGLMTFIKYLAFAQSVDKDMLKIKQEYDGSDLDTLAWREVHNMIPLTALLGAVGGTVEDFIPLEALFSKFGYKKAWSVQRTLAFMVNAQLVLRIAELYGIKLQGPELVGTLAVVSGLGSLALHYKGSAPALGQDLEKLGSELAEAKTSKSPFAWIKRLLTSLKSKRLATTVEEQGILKNDDLVKMEKDVQVAELEMSSAKLEVPILEVKPPVEPVQLDLPIGDAPKSVAAAVESAEANALETAATAADAKIMRRVARTISQRFGLGILAAGFVQGAAKGLFSATETAGMGFAAIHIFRGMFQQHRADFNQKFHENVLLRQKNAEGFLKLLILSLKATDRTPTLHDPETSPSTDLRLAMIVNLARAAKICSPDDITKAKELIANGSVSVSANNPANMLGHTPQEIANQVLAYSCADGAGNHQFARLKKEFLSFNGFPNEFLEGLKELPLELRVRMASYILEIDLFHNDRSPEFITYFEHTVLGYLGLQTKEFTRYFDTLAGYISLNDGLKAAPDSLSGFTVNEKKFPNPFNYRNGPIPVTSPANESLAMQIVKSTQTPGK